jgi:osmotically-inducible protein OsmY
MKRHVGFLEMVIAGIILSVPMSNGVSISSAMETRNGDLWIKAALEAVIEKDGRLVLDDLNVSSHDGIVKLGGVVVTADEKALAELLATQVPGVKGVENDIMVEPPLDQDFKVEKDAERTIIENPLVHITELKIRSRGGIVTLRGIVKRESEKKFAGELLSELPDVERVKDKIEVLHGN